MIMVPLTSSLLWVTSQSEKKIETDVMDYDGIGNYGRIPDKDPK